MSIEYINNENNTEHDEALVIATDSNVDIEKVIHITVTETDLINI